MDTSNVERAFALYLEKCWEPGYLNRIILVYIRLLLLFKGTLPQKVLGVLLEREKQLRGQPFEDSEFENLRAIVRSELNRRIGEGDQSTKEAMLNRLVFCALLDDDETDVFYLTEPISEFTRVMAVSPVELERIVESEFVGFRIDA
jgi:hypothetical protein